MSRYKEVAKFVFDYRDHRNPLVRQSITALLPRIAHFLRDRFVSSYLQVRHYVIVFLPPPKSLNVTYVIFSGGSVGL